VIEISILLLTDLSGKFVQLGYNEGNLLNIQRQSIEMTFAISLLKCIWKFFLVLTSLQYMYITLVLFLCPCQFH
jgi:hypothetical protein